MVGVGVSICVVSVDVPRRERSSLPVISGCTAEGLRQNCEKLIALITDLSLARRPGQSPGAENTGPEDGQNREKNARVENAEPGYEKPKWTLEIDGTDEILSKSVRLRRPVGFKQTAKIKNVGNLKTTFKTNPKRLEAVCG